MLRVPTNVLQANVRSQGSYSGMQSCLRSDKEHLTHNKGQTVPVTQGINHRMVQIIAKEGLSLALEVS